MQLLSETAPPTSRGDARHLARSVALLGPRLSKLLRHQVRPSHGLSMPQFITLRALSRGSKTPGTLAELFGVSRPTMTRMVDGLVKKGLVERRSDDRDRRVTVITLTAAGRELQIATEAAAEEFLTELLSELAPDRLDGLAAGLADLTALLDRADAARSPREHAAYPTRPIH